MTATKRSANLAAKKVAPARTVGKKAVGKKKAGSKLQSPGVFSKAKHMVSAALMSSASGTGTGAVQQYGRGKGQRNGHSKGK